MSQIQMDNGGWEFEVLRKVDWQGKLINEESWFRRKVDWGGKLIDKESKLTRKSDWQEKSIDDSWFEIALQTDRQTT